MPSEKTLSDLRKELRELDNKVKDLLWGKLRPPDSRPFVCNGDPYECKAFIVGCNPASGLRKSSFWEYWPDDDETGFKREEWLRAYESERPLSRTRQNINLIVSRAGAQPHPVKVLETNVYSIPTPSERELRGILKQMDGGVESAAAIFVRLLVEVKPKVIFLHGQTAREAFMNEVSFQPRPETLSTFEFAQFVSGPPSNFPESCRINVPEAEPIAVMVMALPHLCDRGHNITQDVAENIGTYLQHCVHAP